MSKCVKKVSKSCQKDVEKASKGVKKVSNGVKRCHNIFDAVQVEIGPLYTVTLSIYLSFLEVEIRS